MKISLTQSSAAVLLPVQRGVEARYGTAPTPGSVDGTAVPCAARLRDVAADLLGFAAVDALPPPRGAPV